MNGLSSVDKKCIRDAMAAAAANGASPVRLKEIRESLTTELLAMQAATAKPGAVAK
ncbi:hypothetical protein [Caballeronia sp. DA-9]|uniref:hypothetical protein n=1 Tax=Caballeronia sp. DA-9 TaxID=3436237 RepID=UPI003F672FC4